MKKVIIWLKTSNRWKHLVGGFLIGLGADSWFCACYTGVGVGAALELKDVLWGSCFDKIDFTLTAGGALFGHLIRWAVWK